MVANMDKNLKIILFGILAWLIPFAAAFAFYTPEGELQGDVFLFKTVMILVGSLVGAFLFVKYFGSIKSAFAKEGTLAGTSWFLISIILDALILLPMSGMDFSAYFAQIGARYLVMPIFGAAMGFALDNSQRGKGRK